MTWDQSLGGKLWTGRGVSLYEGQGRSSIMRTRRRVFGEGMVSIEEVPRTLITVAVELNGLTVPEHTVLAVE